MGYSSLKCIGISLSLKQHATNVGHTCIIITIIKVACFIEYMSMKLN